MAGAYPFNEALSTSKQLGCQQKSVANFIKSFFIQSNIHQNFSKILRIPNLCLFFLQLQWLLSFQQFCDFSINKSCKTYLRTMLPPGGRFCQVIPPHSFTWVGTGLTCKHETGPERPARNEHSSLLGSFVSCKENRVL